MMMLKKTKDPYHILLDKAHKTLSPSTYSLYAKTLFLTDNSFLWIHLAKEKCILEAATVLVTGSPPIFNAKLAICCLKIIQNL